MYTLTPRVIVTLSFVSATACVSRDRLVWPPASPATGAPFVGGDFLLQWMEVDDPEEAQAPFKWDAVDGGTARRRRAG